MVLLHDYPRLFSLIRGQGDKAVFATTFPSRRAEYRHMSLNVHILSRRLFTNAMSQGEEFLHKFVNHEKKGVPEGAGKDDKGGFDMVRIEKASRSTYSCI